MNFNGLDLLRQSITNGIERAEKEIGYKFAAHVDDSRPNALRFTLFNEFYSRGLSLYVASDLRSDVARAEFLGYHFACACAYGSMVKVLPGETPPDWDQLIPMVALARVDFKTLGFGVVKSVLTAEQDGERAAEEPCHCSRRHDGPCQPNRVDGAGAHQR